MLKKILTRSAVSAPLSIVVNQLVTIIISIIIDDGRYFPVAPAFAAMFKNELTPVVVQLLLVGLIGAVFAGSSVIFEIEKWSFLKQGAVHLAVTSAVFLPVCMLCWRPVNLVTALALAASWIFVYGCTWFSQYLVWRHSIRKLDARIRSVNKDI